MDIVLLGKVKRELDGWVIRLSGLLHDIWQQRPRTLETEVREVREVRVQVREVKGQRTEDKGQRAEFRGQRS